MVIVKKITRCGDGSCQEADIIISDGQFEILCFCHPCSLQEGQEITWSLYPFNADNIMRPFEKTYKVEKILNDYFAYNFIGKLIDKKKGIVIVGKIKFMLGGIPQDIEEYEFISFSCCRVDV